jgi:hypothetical protein
VGLLLGLSSLLSCSFYALLATLAHGGGLVGAALNWIALGIIRFVATRNRAILLLPDRDEDFRFTAGTQTERQRGVLS